MALDVMSDFVTLSLWPAAANKRYTRLTHLPFDRCVIG